MARVERTLVKSPPELWELVDDAELMQRWAGDLVGDPDAEIEVTERSQGERLAWRAGGDGGPGLALSLAEKGWGTNVVIEARRGEHSRFGEVGDDALERLLDELSSPQRRPFTRD